MPDQPRDDESRRSLEYETPSSEPTNIVLRAAKGCLQFLGAFVAHGIAEVVVIVAALALGYFTVKGCS